MCKYCDFNNENCEIFVEPLTTDYYLLHRTDEWDDYNDCFVYDKIYINFCPWCGRQLVAEKEA